MRNPSPVIGILINNFYHDYGEQVVRGIHAFMKGKGGRLFFFAGGSFENPHEKNALHNQVYTLARAECLDGIIAVSASLKPYITSSAYAEFLKSFPAIPMVSLGEALPGRPSVTVDNRVGMHELVTHLVEAHGCRNIAIIKGPEKSADAQARFQAFQDALAHHDLPANPDLVFPGSYYADAARRAVAHLVDDRRAEFDAVIGSNDHTARFVVEELKRRGYRIPEDVIVAGYDDTQECVSGRPLLTTVRQPCFELGFEAARKLCSLLENNGDDSPLTLASQVMIRESCGCQPTEIPSGGHEALHHLRLIDMRLYGFRKKMLSLSRWEDFSKLMRFSLPHFAISSCYVFTDRETGSGPAGGYRLTFACAPGGTAEAGSPVFRTEEEITSWLAARVSGEACIVCPMIYGDDLSGYAAFGIGRDAMAADRESGVHPGKVCESLAMELGAFVHAHTGNNTPPRPSRGKGRPAGFSLPERTSLEIFKKLSLYMKRGKPYLDDELTLHKLSERLRIPRNYLSLAIKRHGGTNFYGFIFRYRIQEAEKLLSRSEPGKGGILDIAYRCGFKSKSTFNKAFKEMTGMTPGEFKSAGASDKRREKRAATEKS